MLVPKGYATQELLDTRHQQMNAAAAALIAAEARIGQATHGLDAATQDVALLQVNIADNTLVAPRDGRVQYRLANLGEVLPAGGKVFTLLDLSYVYMDIFLPTLQAGKVVVGSEGRILLDALPDQPLPGKVLSSPTRRSSPPRWSRPGASATSSCSGSGSRSTRRCCALIPIWFGPAFPAWAMSGWIPSWPGPQCSSPSVTGDPLAPPVAVLDRLSHRYGATLALDGISLSLPAGRAVGLIGPDGVGKSTLLALIAGAAEIQRGSVAVLDGDMRRRRHRRQVCPRIAYMPQGLGKNIYPDLSLRENIAFFGRLFGLGAAERRERIDGLLRDTGLAPFADRQAKKLSGGMRQKLGLCCALIHDPDLLILDEPTTGVDPSPAASSGASSTASAPAAPA